MIITVAVTVCHLVMSPSEQDVAPRDRDRIALCHEEIVSEGDGSMQSCFNSQAAVADWKSKSNYAGPQWTVARIKCVPGHYEKRDAI